MTILNLARNDRWRVWERSVAYCHREERGDLGCEGLTNSQKRDCRAALAMTKLNLAGNDKQWQGRNDNIISCSQ